MVKKYLYAVGLLVAGLFLPEFKLCAQEKTNLPDTVAQKDVNDLFREVFKKNKKPDTTKKKNGSMVILPSFNYTVSNGFAFGADFSVSKYLGDPKKTTLSLFDLFAEKATKTLALVQLRHNIYTSGDKWILQGNWELGKTEVVDHGIGTGRDDPGEFPIKYTYIKFSEKVSKKVVDHFFAGAGLAYNYYTNIDDERLNGEHSKTFNHFYSLKNGYPAYGYLAGGLLFDLQYNTKDHPFRPYRGLFVNVTFRLNQTWLGSEKDATQIKTELRKYWSLSRKNPEHVLAFWLWGSYLLKGSVPYLELPATGSDPEQRMGRGYTISRFKGPSYFYNELEYRFPITRNKLISGVAFFNMQTANNQRTTKLFQYWEPGGGGGLRILFDKHTRTNLCLDYGFGNYGSNGISVGINETF